MKRKIIRYVLDPQIHPCQSRYPLHFEAECDSLGLPKVIVYETCGRQPKSGERGSAERYAINERVLRVVARGKEEIQSAISGALLNCVPPLNYQVEIDDFEITPYPPSSRPRSFISQAVWGSRKPGDHSDNV